uniref:Uncharacterized protein n=1 Tax=Arion vulgaris TaxID=1028688 RepID=A0A0B7A189_9EUPU
MEFQRMRRKNDIGTIIKSESGVAHLLLNKAIVPTETLTVTSETNIEDNLIRHSLEASSSLPVSSESVYSQSSCDSVISDSTYSVSHDGSVNSAPQTPDEPQDKDLNWSDKYNLPSSQSWQELLTSSNNWDTQQSDTCRQSTSQLEEPNSQHDDDINIDWQTSSTSTTLMSPKMWSRKFHEAEKKIQTLDRPQLSLLNKNSDMNNSMNPSIHSSQTFNHLGNISYNKHHHYGIGSPPPNVVLRTLPTAARQDGLPFKFDYNRTYGQQRRRRSSLDLSELRHDNISVDMQSIRHEDYVNVKSKPIIISPESTPSLNLAASSDNSKAKLSKYMNMTKDQPSYIKNNEYKLPQVKQQSPGRPLNYQEAIQRSYLMKHNMAANQTETQRENSARAKAMYEKSMQIFDKQSANSHLAYDRELQYKLNEPLTSDASSNKYLESTPFGYRSHKSFLPTVTTDNLDDSGASGFLDMGSISHSLQEDIVNRQRRRQIVGPGSLLSLSSHTGQLSDTGSSSGSSSVTISTLSKHSDSFGNSSDLSNSSRATVSSVTSSSDMSCDVNSSMSKHRSLPRFDQQSDDHMKLDSECDTTLDVDEMLDSEDDDDVYDTLKLNPEQIYLQSIQLYQEKISSSNKTSSMLPSLSHNLQQQQQPSSREQPSKFSVPILTNSPRKMSAETKARIHLEVPNVILHRSSSDSIEQAHKLEAYKSAKSSYSDSKNGLEIQQTSHENAQNKSLPQDIKTELHQNFLKARSCFHQPVSTDHTANVISHQYSAQISSLSSQNIKSDKLTQPTLLSATVAQSVLSPQVTKSQEPYSHPSDSTSSSSKENRQEFHWSVKDLKSKYNKDMLTDSATGSNNKPNLQMSSQPRPHSPPPYQNPPSLRHPPDSLHHSTSSREQVLDSKKTSHKTIKAHRQGPQSYVYETSYNVGMYSSSDDSCSSPPDRSMWLSSSSMDGEELSDYTNTTYI